jgi:hypothetical protein
MSMNGDDCDLVQSTIREAVRCALRQLDKQMMIARGTMMTDAAIIGAIRGCQDFLTTPSDSYVHLLNVIYAGLVHQCECRTVCQKEQAQKHPDEPRPTRQATMSVTPFEFLYSEIQARLSQFRKAATKDYIEDGRNDPKNLVHDILNACLDWASENGIEAKRLMFAAANRASVFEKG